jgi:nucleoside-diphosphate-sugar epimerase
MPTLPSPQPRRLLITGISGVIGQILHQHLSSDYEVTGVDKNAITTPSVYHTDLSQLDQARALFAQLGPLAAVIHLAANPDPSAPPAAIFRDNFTTTRNLYHCAHEFQVPRVVSASSTHIFGGHPGYPYTSYLPRKILPGDPFSSDSDYADSKIYGELLADRFYHAYHIETISLRIGQVSAANQPVPPYTSLWLSHRDLAQVFGCALATLTPFGAYFAMSDNPGLVFDLAPTTRDLGYHPQDSAEHRIAPPN